MKLLIIPLNMEPKSDYSFADIFQSEIIGGILYDN